MTNTSWAVWMVLILLLIVSIGIVIWFAIDNNIPGKIGTNQETFKISDNTT